MCSKFGEKVDIWRGQNCKTRTKWARQRAINCFFEDQNIQSCTWHIEKHWHYFLRLLYMKHVQKATLERCANEWKQSSLYAADMLWCSTAWRQTRTATKYNDERQQWIPIRITNKKKDTLFEWPTETTFCTLELKHCLMDCQIGPTYVTLNIIANKFFLFFSSFFQFWSLL